MRACSLHANRDRVDSPRTSSTLHSARSFQTFAHDSHDCRMIQRIYHIEHLADNTGFVALSLFEQTDDATTATATATRFEPPVTLTIIEYQR